MKSSTAKIKQNNVYLRGFCHRRPRKRENVKKTEKVLSANGISAYDALENGEFRINEGVGDTSKLIASLVGAGVAVYELTTVQSTLEQYYLNRTGGNV